MSDITDDTTKFLKIPLNRRSIAQASVQMGYMDGYEKGLRPHKTILKTFWKLSDLHDKMRQKHEDMLDRQMLQESGYDPAMWAEIDEIEDQLARISGAVSALYWTLQLSDAIDVQMFTRPLVVNLSDPYHRDDKGNKIRGEHSL